MTAAQSSGKEVKGQTQNPFDPRTIMEERRASESERGETKSVRGGKRRRVTWRLQTWI